MILSPDSWFWATYGGFYAVAASVPFFVWTLVFFCLALEKENLWLFFLTALFYGLSWLFHPMAGVIGAMAMVILGFGFGVKFYGLKNAWKGLTKTLVIITLGILVFAWWIFPFLTREEMGGIGLGAEQMFRTTLKAIVGLEMPKETYNTETFFTASAVILFVIGALIAFLRKSILRWAVLACALALFIMTAPNYAQPIVEKFQVFWTATNTRTGLILRVLGPIIGAYGAVSLIRPLFWLIEKWVKNLKENKFWCYGTQSVGGLIGFLVFWLLLKTVVIIPPLGEGADLVYSGFGPWRMWSLVDRVDNQAMVLDHKTEELTLPLFKDPKTILKEVPEIFSLVGEAISPEDLRTKLTAEKSKVTSQERVDISPLQGGMSGSLGNFSQVAQIPPYFGTSLIQPMIGWQIDCVYYSPLCGPAQIEDVYRWFGVSQAWRGLGGDELFAPIYGEIKARLDGVGLLKPETLHLGLVAKAETYWDLYHFQEPIGLASITNKPTILVIGDNPPNNDVFDIVFRGLTKVNFGYQDAWSVKGKRFIDDYKLSELSQFEMIALHGYQYHNQNKTWALLEKYVNQGGRLFIDTGWQYTSQDWGKIVKGKSVAIEMPKIFPVEKTIWGDIEGGWRLGLGDHPITQEVNRSDWGKPIWRGKAWGAATAEKEWLRPGAASLLENQGQILAAVWEYGKGRVAWTGFDFWGHLVEYQANDERKLVRNILDWLVGNESWEKKLDFQREKPELIKISFSQSSGKNKLMFKEVASDNWIARLNKEKLPIYKAGPGWKMVFLPSQPSNGQIVFSWRKNKIEVLGLVVSVLTVILILAYGVSKIVNRDWDKRFLTKISNIFKGKIKRIKKSWEDEEQ